MDQALHGRALQALQLGNWAGARHHLTDALLAEPNNLELVSLLGVALRREQDHPAAVACCSYVLMRQPRHVRALTCRALLHLDAQDPTSALDLLRLAVTLDPQQTALWRNLGLAASQAGQPDLAAKAYQRSLQLEPTSVDSWSNLGRSLRQSGDLDAAIRCFEHCCQLEAGRPEHHFNLALALLQAGKFVQGWREFHWRLACSSPRTMLPIPLEAAPKQLKEVWNRRVILVAEQGLGDTIQFMRYGPALRPWVREIVLCVPDKLHDLCASMDDWSEVVNAEQAQRWPSAVRIPMLSLPGLLEIQPKEGDGQPYLPVDQEREAQWHQRFQHDHPEQLIVGLNWQGNPQAEQTDGFRGRSLPLELLAPLAAVPGVRFVALQKGPGQEQLAACSFRQRFVASQDQVSDIWDFPETAAISRACDLVITTDTSLAHLSGAIGQVTWLLLQAIPDWRWGLRGSRTAWYDRMRLFRQPSSGDWEGVINDVSEELRLLVSTQQKTGL